MKNVPSLLQTDITPSFSVPSPSSQQNKNDVRDNNNCIPSLMSSSFLLILHYKLSFFLTLIVLPFITSLPFPSFFPSIDVWVIRENKQKVIVRILASSLMQLFKPWVIFQLLWHVYIDIQYYEYYLDLCYYYCYCYYCYLLLLLSLLLLLLLLLL